MVTLSVTLSDADIRLCEVCGTSLEGKHRHALTCSPACRKAKSRGNKGRQLRQARVEHWSQAAETVYLRLDEWILRTLDIAAESLGPR